VDSSKTSSWMRERSWMGAQRVHTFASTSHDVHEVSDCPRALESAALAGLVSLTTLRVA